MEQRQYLRIDQKSFYAMVKCVERGLNPMVVGLVVADTERFENLGPLCGRECGQPVSLHPGQFPEK